MAITFLSSSVNPDSGSIVNKEQIDISLSLFDVSGSAGTEKIQTDFSATSQVIVLPETENSPIKSYYYTPIYKEKLNYDVWLTRINKNFEELD